MTAPQLRLLLAQLKDYHPEPTGLLLEVAVVHGMRTPLSHEEWRRLARLSRGLKALALTTLRLQEQGAAEAGEPEEDAPVRERQRLLIAIASGRWLLAQPVTDSDADGVLRNQVRVLQQQQVAFLEAVLGVLDEWETQRETLRQASAPQAPTGEVWADRMAQQAYDTLGRQATQLRQAVLDSLCEHSDEFMV